MNIFFMNFYELQDYTGNPPPPPPARAFHQRHALNENNELRVDVGGLSMLDVSLGNVTRST